MVYASLYAIVSARCQHMRESGAGLMAGGGGGETWHNRSSLRYKHLTAVLY